MIEVRLMIWICRMKPLLWPVKSGKIGKIERVRLICLRKWRKWRIRTMMHISQLSSTIFKNFYEKCCRIFWKINQFLINTQRQNEMKKVKKITFNLKKNPLKFQKMKNKNIQKYEYKEIKEEIKIQTCSNHCFFAYSEAMSFYL